MKKLCQICGSIHDANEIICNVCGGEEMLPGINIKGFEEDDYFLEVLRYDNGTTAISLAVSLKDEYDEYSIEPYLDITTNIQGAELLLEEDEILVKTWSENESVLPSLLESGWFEDTGKKVKVSDWCSAAIWKFIPKKDCK